MSSPPQAHKRARCTFLRQLPALLVAPYLFLLILAFALTGHNEDRTTRRRLTARPRRCIGMKNSPGWMSVPRAPQFGLGTILDVAESIRYQAAGFLAKKLEPENCAPFFLDLAPKSTKKIESDGLECTKGTKKWLHTYFCCHGAKSVKT